MGRRTKLTPEVQKIIVDVIRKGAYDWVAAGAAGIHSDTFRNWMRWGEKGNERYIPFFKEVRKARADARSEAEIRVFGDNPFNWLRYGPGRERPGEPGWTEHRQLEHSGEGGGPVVIKVIRAGPRPQKPDDEEEVSG